MGESKICSENKQFNFKGAELDVEKQQSHPISDCSIVSVVIYKLYHYAMHMLKMSLIMMFPTFWFS